VTSPAPTRGIATADVNGDGRLDFAVASQWAESWLYLNRCTACGRSLTLRLARRPAGERGGLELRQGDAAELRGPAPIGANVSLRVNGKPAGHAQVDGGNGHASVRSTSLSFGLGDVPADARVEANVRWRDAHGRVREQDLTLTPGRWAALLPEG
jgi:hypothetical protein